MKSVRTTRRIQASQDRDGGACRLEQLIAERQPLGIDPAAFGEQGRTLAERAHGLVHADHSRVGALRQRVGWEFAMKAESPAPGRIDDQGHAVRVA